MGKGQVWEEIVELARRIDHRVAAREGIDNDDVVRLAQALLAFQDRLSGASVETPELDPRTGGEAG